jgi:iron complex outermembrane receptor protein
VNIPLNDELSARINFQTRNADGYMTNLASGAKWNDEGETAVRASVAWTPSDRFDARFSADIVRRDELPSLASCEWFGPADGSTAAGLPAVLFLGGVYDTIANGCDMGDAYSAYELDPAVSTTDSESFGLVMNVDLGGGTLTSVSSYRATEHVNSSWGNASDGGTVNYIDVIAACDTCQDILYDFDYFSQEIRLDGSSLDGRLTWVAGFYYYTEESHSGDGVPILRGYVPPSAEAWPLFYVPGIADIVMGTQMFGSRDQRYDTKNTSTAFFVESVYQVNDKFDFGQIC